ncbi:unnamed protein product [Adineta steineri]|uniref:Uncharacterized protein n=1 Tax=Adineta steineri TaxID=433720 RepID=A0A815YZK0_9BILA|nr:unnamed protein product [Adineta steineri]CAF1576699.1 unnamed protein product [Adineta steineri]
MRIKLSIYIETTTQTWKQRAQTLAKPIWNSLVNLNLFKSSPRQQPSDIRQQLWTTRIYITLLILALIILTLYGMLSFETKLIQVNKPSFSTVQQLQSKSQINLISSLQCPCTQLTVSYGQFIQFHPFYHQICSSDFISERWIDAFDDITSDFLQQNVFVLAYVDFLFSQTLFVLLKGLCSFSNETIANALQTFEQNQLVDTQLLTVDEFTNQISSVINQFELETKNTFLHFLQLLRNITHVNQILSGTGSNYIIDIASPPNYTTSLSIATYYDDNSSDICSCANDSSCKMNWGLFTGNPAVIQVYTIPEFYYACQPVESLLQSTLKCFYDDQDCLSIIINFYNVSSFNNFTRLNSSSHASRFMRNSTIGSLLSEMFIESWSESTNYSSYFAQCQPSSCSYTISQRNSLLEILTTLVGLIGGLSVSLRILVPFLVMACIGVIQRLFSQRQRTLTEATSPLSHVVRVGTKIRDWFKKVNVFEDTNRTITIQQQCVATRVYLLLLVISLFIVVLYTSLIYYLNTFTITKPSLEQYQQLQQRYGSEAVSCPCSRPSITHSSFITLQCEFHPVCTSPFTSDLYLQELFQLYNDSDSTYATTNAFTLQGTIFSYFQALAALCNLVNDFVNDAKQQYLVASIISTLMIDFDLFEKDTNASLIEFQSTLPNSFLNSLQIIRGLTQGNGFVSAYSTNWYYVTKNINEGSMLYLKPQYYGSDMCNCATSSTCTQSSTPYIKGYLVGCTPLESLLQSTLECLYEESCIDLLTTYLNMSLSNYLVPLNKSETRFSSNGTVNSIVQEMFVETCSSNVSYNQFFEECKPDYCSVTILEPVVSCTNLTFAATASYPVGAKPQATAIGDFNGDGILDLVIVNNDDNTVSVLLGVGSGLFGSQTTFPTGLIPVSAAVGDFNGDGRLDLAVVNYGDNTMSVLLGTGSGSFGPQIIYSTGFYPCWIVVRDLNGDGRLDLVVANSYSSNVGVFIGIGNGFFGPQTTYSTIAMPISIAINDFNGDAYLDLVVISSYWPTISVLLGTGTGTFQLQTTFSTNSGSYVIATGDFNSDDQVDIVVGNGYPWLPNLGVLLGNGDGSFGLSTTFSVGFDSVLDGAAIGDLNGDGRLDLVVSSSYTLADNIRVLLGTGNGSFVLQTPLATESNSAPYGIAISDLNNDGRLDLAFCDSTAENVLSIFLNTCT